MSDSLSPQMKAAGDAVIAAVKAHVERTVAPLLETQRDLIARLDRQAQQISALNKQVSALQKKA